MTDANFTPEFDPADVDSDYGTTGGDITVPTFHDLKPFKFWCQKALPLVYDDSLSYYEVLCKVVNYLNNMMSDLTTGTGAITQFSQQFVINQAFINNMAAKLGQNTAELESYINDRMGDFTTAYNELQDYVNAYFNNLDVQDEIDNKLDEMAESGQFNVLFDPVIQAWMEEETEFINTNIATQNSTLATQNSRISVLEGRMDTFASLPSGSTSGNAELLDIRTNFLGETFGSAGDAVRASDYIASGFSSQPCVDEVFSAGTANYAFFNTTNYKGGKYAIILNSFNNTLLTAQNLVVNDNPSFITGDPIALYADSDETSGHAHVSDYLNDYVETITETYSDGYRLLITFSIPQDSTYTYIGLKYYLSLTGSITPHRIGYASNWINAPVDPTLSIEGDAADAKATGDAVTQLNERLSSETSQLYNVIERDEGIVDAILDGTDPIVTNNYFKLVQGDLAAGVLVASSNTVTTEDFIDNSSANNFTLHYDSTNFKINIVRFDAQKAYLGNTGFITIEPIRIRQYVTDPYVKVSIRRTDNSNLTPSDTALYTVEEKTNDIAYKAELDLEHVTEISVNPNGGADYTTIRGAIESVTNPSVKNRYIINVYPGTYDLKQEYTNVWTDDSFIGCTVPAFTKLKGIGKRGSVILTATDTESTESHRLNMSTLNLKQSSELENLTITGAGLKYTVHDDYNSDKYLGFREIRDVVVTGDAPLTASIWGAGAWQNTKTRFINCEFSSNTKTSLIYIHTSTSADYPSYFEFINCRFKSYNTSFGDCRLNLSSVLNTKNTPCYVSLFGTKVRTVYLTKEGGNTNLNWVVNGFGNEIHGVETTITGADPQADLIGTATYARYSDGAY